MWVCNVRKTDSEVRWRYKKRHLVLVITSSPPVWDLCFFQRCVEGNVSLQHNLLLSTFVQGLLKWNQYPNPTDSSFIIVLLDSNLNILPRFRRYFAVKTLTAYMSGISRVWTLAAYRSSSSLETSTFRPSVRSSLVRTQLGTARGEANIKMNISAWRDTMCCFKHLPNPQVASLTLRAFVVVWMTVVFVFFREAAAIHLKALISSKALQQPTHRSSFWL